MREVDDYLADLSDRLDVGEAAKEEVLREVGGHLQAAVQERVRAGSDHATAVREVIRDFGAPREVAAAVNRAYEESPGQAQIGLVLAAIFLPEGDTRRARLRLARLTIVALVLSLLAPVFFVVLPTLGLQPGGTANNSAGPWDWIAQALPFAMLPATYWLSNRLDGLGLRDLLRINGLAVVLTWLSALLCVGAGAIWLYDPRGILEVNAFLPALATGANPNSAASLAAFLILPAFYTVGSHQMRNEARRLRA